MNPFPPDHPWNASFWESEEPMKADEIDEECATACDECGAPAGWYCAEDCPSFGVDV